MATWFTLSSGVTINLDNVEHIVLKEYDSIPKPSNANSPWNSSHGRSYYTATVKTSDLTKSYHEDMKIWEETNIVLTRYKILMVSGREYTNPTNPLEVSYEIY